MSVCKIDRSFDQYFRTSGMNFYLNYCLTYNFYSCKALTQNQKCNSSPGNMVVDGLMHQLFGEPFDDSGTHVSIVVYGNC